MESILSQLNAVPGVVGSLVCDREGHLLAQTFPPLFEPAMLRDTAAAVADGAVALASVTGPVSLMDLRFNDARVLVRPMAGANLMFLCAGSVNLQLLLVSASVAVPKLEKLVAARPAGAAAGGQLYQTVQRIDAAIARKRLDPFKVRGQIAIRVGMSLDLIGADTPDDSGKLARLREAASAVLGEPV